MMFQPQRKAIGKTARFGDLFGRQRPARHRHAEILARLRRRIGGEGQLNLWLMRQRAGRAGQHLFELFKGGLVSHVCGRL